MKNFCKTIFLSALRVCHPQLSGASILMYHSVGNNDKFFTVTLENFERQMKYLKEKNFSIMLLSTLVDRMRNKKQITNTVVVTFDDGYKDNFEIAYPILRKYNFPVTIFVTTGFIGKTEMMAEENVRKISADGLIEIMPHSVTHPHLSKISFEEARREIENSRRAIEAITAKPGDIFAYPYGDYSSEIVEYLQNGDWHATVSVREGIVKTGDDLFTLKRNSIDRTTTFSQFKAKVSDAIELYTKLKS